MRFSMLWSGPGGFTLAWTVGSQLVRESLFRMAFEEAQWEISEGALEGREIGPVRHHVTEWSRARFPRKVGSHSTESLVAMTDR